MPRSTKHRSVKTKSSIPLVVQFILLVTAVVFGFVCGVMVMHKDGTTTTPCNVNEPNQGVAISSLLATATTSLRKAPLPTTTASTLTAKVKSKQADIPTPESKSISTTSTEKEAPATPPPPPTTTITATDPSPTTDPTSPPDPTTTSPPTLPPPPTPPTVPTATQPIASQQAIVRQKKVTVLTKTAFQDKHIYIPQSIEKWTISTTNSDNCISVPKITSTERRVMKVHKKRIDDTDSWKCISSAEGTQVEECPKVSFSEDSSFLVCRAKGALGAQDLLKVGGSERRIADTFAAIVRADGGWSTRPQIIDVGMNEGFFSLLSASLGGNVIAFDMNPVCFAAMDKAIELNGFENAIELRNVGLIKGDSSTINEETMSIQSESCDPAGKLSSTECSWCPKRTNVPVVPLDVILLKSSIAMYSLLKIDAEGSEIGIMEGALETIGSGRVKRMVIELAPDWWTNFGVSLDHGISIINQVLDKGDFQSPYVYKAPGENLGVGLTHEFKTIFGVEDFLQINNLDSFVRDRSKRRQGCNMLLIKKDVVV